MQMNVGLRRSVPLRRQRVAQLSALALLLFSGRSPQAQTCEISPIASSGGSFDNRIFVSGNGNFVSFASTLDLVTDSNTDENKEIFVYDLTFPPAARMACQTREGEAGMPMSVTPCRESACTIALTTRPRAGVVPPSPPGRMPCGCELAGTSMISVLNDGIASARGSA
jgi:hypothetical protein